jgi:methylase of polypeptide subunit release factors
LSSARRELKWIGEHARNVARRTLLTSWQAVLHRCCLDRARGKPLQYILGTEFFGELELKCRPGVLIPR